MNIEVLIATMHQTDYSLLDKMNIKTKAIVGNQCHANKIDVFEHNGKTIKWLSFDEKGVGLNRNNALMRSDADICILADDDMVFKDTYEDIVIQLFRDNPNVDVIIFNIDEKVSLRYKNKKQKRIHLLNYGRYGAARIAFRRERIQKKNIYFNVLFGGGAKYSSGEDSIFIHECLKKRLKIIAVPIAIAELTNERESTWFQGYNDKYFYDKGVFYGTLYGKRAVFIAFYNCLKHRNGRYVNYGYKNAIKKMKEGINDAL